MSVDIISTDIFIRVVWQDEALNQTDMTLDAFCKQHPKRAHEILEQVYAAVNHADTPKQDAWTKRDRAINQRREAPIILTQHNISFVTKNNGLHIIVQTQDGFIDFWPGTGKFIARNGKHHGRGVTALVKLCNQT